MSTEKQLVNALHISKPEAQIYLAALQKRHSTVTDLATTTKIPRTAIYGPLKKLQQRGLVSETKLGKRVHYQAVSPTNLLKVLERERVELSLAVAELEQRIDVPEDDMSVQYFRGTNGLFAAVDLFFEACAPGSLLRTVEHPALTLEKVNEKILDHYREVRLHKKISAHIINPINKMTPWLEERLKKKEEELMEVIQISEENYPRPAGFLTNGSQLLLLHYRAVPSATLITSKDVAETFASMHKMVWDRYKV